MSRRSEEVQRLMVGSEVVGYVVSPADWERLCRLNESAAERERAERRGAAWERWEEELMLDDELEDTDIAIQTKRTLKSIREHRRWVRRVAEAAGGVLP